MWNIFRTRLAQGQRTSTFPAEAPELPPRFRGRLALEEALCEDGCSACEDACPTDAITLEGGVSLDLGRCLFCTECVDVCPTKALSSTSDYRLATTSREALVVRGQTLELAERLSEDVAKRFGRSLGIRVVSAGGCAGCEAEVNALSNIVFDISRFGVHVVASPRHADALLVTGPVSAHMKGAVEATYRAIPAPKFVIAVGACAISGGPYAESPQVQGGVASKAPLGSKSPELAGGSTARTGPSLLDDALASPHRAEPPLAALPHHDSSALQTGRRSSVPVDLYIPGCPPHPYTLIDGILRALGHTLPPTR